MHDLSFINRTVVRKRAKLGIKRIERIWQMMIWGSRASRCCAVTRRGSFRSYLTNGWDGTLNALKEMANIWGLAKCWNCTPKNGLALFFESKDFLKVSVRAFMNPWRQPLCHPGTLQASVTSLMFLLLKNSSLSRGPTKPCHCVLHTEWQGVGICCLTCGGRGTQFTAGERVAWCGLYGGF